MSLRSVFRSRAGNLDLLYGVIAAVLAILLILGIIYKFDLLHAASP